MIVAGLCHSYKLEAAFLGIHQPGDRYMIALYRGSADLSPETTTYEARGEVSGDGYRAGGQPLTGFAPDLQDGTAFADWNDPVWPAATITARGALIYNASKGNRAVVVLDFGEDKGSINAPFRAIFPTPSAETAIVRLR